MTPLLLASLLLSPQGTAADSLESLVWTAVDAAPEREGRALKTLKAHAEVDWKRVMLILARGRSYPRQAPSSVAVEDSERYLAWHGSVEWKRDAIVTYHVMDDPGTWYTYQLPSDYDGTAAIPVFVNLSWLPIDERAAREGWATVKLHPYFMGGAPFFEPDVSIPMTGGSQAQSVLQTIVADLERRFHVDRDRIVIGGYSRFGNVAWYQAFHRPDLWGGVVPAAGYFNPELLDGLDGNLEHLPILAAAGRDRMHRASNAFTRSTAKRLRSLGFAKVTLHESEPRAIDDPFGDRLWEFLEEARRNPLPRKFRFATNDPRHRFAYWIEILKTSRTGGTHPMVIGSPGGEILERIERHRRTASVEIEVLDRHTVTIRAERVTKLRLHLSPLLFDLSQPLEIRLGSRTRKLQVSPSIDTLIQSFRRHRDCKRLFPAFVDLSP